MLNKDTLSLTRATLKRWFFIQMTVVLTASLVLFFFFGAELAISLLAGGIIVMLPNALFACWWLTDYKAKAANRLLGKFYLGEIMKLVLMGVLFVLALKYLLFLNVLVCLIGLMVAQFGFWAGPLCQSRAKSTSC